MTMTWGWGWKAEAVPADFRTYASEVEVARDATGDLAFGGRQHRDRQSTAQPDAEHDVLEMTSMGVELLESGYRHGAAAELLGISPGVLDVPPSDITHETVRAGPGAPPLATVPVAQIVSALPTRLAPIGHLVPPQSGRGQPPVDQLIAARQHVVVGPG